MDNAIHWINLYILCITIYPVDKQLGPSFSELYWLFSAESEGIWGASTQLRNIFARSYKIMIFYFLALGTVQQLSGGGAEKL